MKQSLSQVSIARIVTRSMLASDLRLQAVRPAGITL